MFLYSPSLSLTHLTYPLSALLICPNREAVRQIRCRRQRQHRRGRVPRHDRRHRRAQEQGEAQLLSLALALSPDSLPLCVFYSLLTLFPFLRPSRDLSFPPLPPQMTDKDMRSMFAAVDFDQVCSRNSLIHSPLTTSMPLRFHHCPTRISSSCPLNPTPSRPPPYPIYPGRRHRARRVRQAAHAQPRRDQGRRRLLCGRGDAHVRGRRNGWLRACVRCSLLPS